jgi:hypothetical protein
MVISSGDRGLRNERSPLWATIDAPGAEAARPATARLLADYFDALHSRHIAAAKAARDGARRARYGGG